jgi:hypothetical protein
MSWEEMNDAAAVQLLTGPRFQNSLEERFADLQLWETVWDEVHMRGPRRSCPGRRGSGTNGDGTLNAGNSLVGGNKPWEKVKLKIYINDTVKASNFGPHVYLRPFFFFVFQ